MKNKVFAVLSIIIVLSMVMTGCTPASTTPDCSKADVFCVGLVTDVGKVDDKSFNQSAYEGLKQAEKDLSAQVKYVETTDSKDYAKNISTFADQKYDVIVTVGFALGEATIAAAKQYPDIKFMVLTSHRVTLLQLDGVIFDEDKSGYLAGVLAGLMSKSVKWRRLSTDVVPAVWRFGEGYRAGIVSCKPDAKSTLSIIKTLDLTRPSPIPNGERPLRFP